MEREQRIKPPENRQKNLIEEFRDLMDSGYWSHLPQRTKEDILSLLNEHPKNSTEGKESVGSINS